MGSSEKRDAEIAEGLRVFFSRAAALRQRPITSDLSGLLLFLQKAGPFLRVAKPSSPRPTRPPLDFGHLSAAFSRLQVPLRTAQRSGATLNVWAIAGLRRNELRNAAVLAWFLDPQGSHGLGPVVLATFLNEVTEVNPGWIDVRRDFSRVTVQTEEWPLGSEANRVDIALDGPDFAIFIEVKIDALEGSNQLSRYAELAYVKAAALGKKQGRVIFLSPRPPRNPPPGVAVVTWRSVARTLANLPRGDINRALARQFADHVRAFF